MRKQKLVQIILILTLLMQFFSWGSIFSSTQFGPQATIISLASNPVLDPLMADDIDSINTVMQVCDGLYIYNYSSPEMESIPNLASAMGTWSVNGTGDLVILTIPLKVGVTFHDGSKFNASAVKWNFDRLQYWTYGFDIDNDGELENHTTGASTKELFKFHNTAILNRTEIVDEYTVAFHLNLESVNWEKIVTHVACSIMLPDIDYFYGEKFFNQIEFDDELIGTGPYILEEYMINDEIIFTLNLDYHYWRSEYSIHNLVYKIVIDSEERALALLNYSIQWSTNLPDFQSEFDEDQNIVTIPRKTSQVIYIRMNVEKIPYNVRQASQWCWNHSQWLNDTWGGKHYELHTPIPDRMQFYHTSFDGEPYIDIERAREYILNTSDPGLVANITSKGLDELSSDEEWIEVAESPTPIAQYTYTKYTDSLIDEFASIQLIENMKLIGIHLERFYLPMSMDLVPWYLQQPNPITIFNETGYSIGRMTASYNDPLTMIEPLYHSNASQNMFLLNDSHLDGLINQSYSTTEFTTPTREELFYDIQEYIVKNVTPSFYIMQKGDYIHYVGYPGYADKFYEQLNIFGYHYWFVQKFWFPKYYHYYPFDTLKINLICLISIAAISGLYFTIYFLKKRITSKKIRKMS